MSVKSIMVVTKPDCPHCVRAKAALNFDKVWYMELCISSKDHIADKKLAETVAPMTTFPMVVEMGAETEKLIGGADELEEYLLSADLDQFVRSGSMEASPVFV